MFRFHITGRKRSELTMFITKCCTSRKILHQVLCQSVLIAVLLAVGACSRRYSDVPAFSPIPFEDYDNHGVGRFKTSFLADQIDQYYRGSNPGPIGVTTLVNLDDLYTTSTFGRVYSEQLISELAMRGYDVVELRHADALQFMASDGEFMLSRDVRSVKRQRDLGGVVVGTYIASPDRVYVNARLIDPASSMVLSAGSVEMPKTKEIARLIRGGSFPATLERIPVKHLGFSAYPVNVFAPGASAYSNEEAGPAQPSYFAAPPKQAWSAPGWNKPQPQIELK